MRQLIVLSACIVSLFLVSQTWAATRYVSTTGSDANSCAASENIATPKLTWASARACMTAGDTLFARGGTYTDNSTLSFIGVNGTPSAYLTISGYQDEIVTLAPPNGNRVLIVSASSYIIFEKMVWDGINSVNTASGENRVEGNSHHLIFRNLDIKRWRRNGIYLDTGTDILIEDNLIHDQVSEACEPGTRYYAIYYHHGSNNSIIRRNRIYGNPGGGMQLYPGPHTGLIVDSNIVTGNSFCTSSNVGGILAGTENTQSYTGGQIINNLVYGNRATTPTSPGPGSGITLFKNVNNTKVFNNTVYDNDGHGLKYVDGTTPPNNNFIANNILLGNTSGAISSGGTNNTLTTNKTTGAIGDCTVSTTDLTLKDSSPCATAGTAQAGFPFNGSNPPQGALYPFTFSSATINGSFLDATLGMNRDTPVQPTAAGFSVTCTVGAGCPGTPTVTNAQLLTGTSGVVRLTVNWTCSTDDVITVTYNAATGATVNSARVGKTVNQELSSFTTQPVTNACEVAPPAAPGTIRIKYLFDENTGTTVADEETTEGGDEPGTLTNGPTWEAPGKNGASAVHFALNGNDFVAVPHGSGLDPSATSWTTCMWVKPDAGTESSTYIYAGVPNGTNQRMYMGWHTGTWSQGVQASAQANNSEFPVSAGWTRVCQRVDASANIVSLAVNGVVGSSAQSNKSVTSYSLSANFSLGTHVVTGGQPGVAIDDFVFYSGLLSNADILTDFENAEPPSTPPTGTLSQVADRFVGALAVGGSAVVLTHVSPGGLFGWERQVNCTVADCSSLSEKVFYSCALCPSAGAWLGVNDTLGPDQIAYAGTGIANVLTGSVACCLSGSGGFSGSTQQTSAAVPVYDLTHDNTDTDAIVNRSIFQIGPSAGIGWEYCFKAYNQTGLELDSYTPSGGGCITVSAPSANGFASLSEQPTGLTVTPNPTQVSRLLAGHLAPVGRSSW